MPPARPNPDINHPTGGHRHRRGRRAGRRVQERRHEAIERQHRLSDQRTLITVALTTEPTISQLSDHDVTADPPPRQSASRDEDSRREQHRALAPPPSERARDAGESISVRIERHPGPEQPGARTPRLAEYGGDSRCLARPTRLTERRTLRICASTAAVPTSAGTATPRQGADVTGGHQHGRASKPPLRIGHLNVRSLLPSIDDVNTALKTHNLDVLCIGESWLNPTVTNNFLVFPGYTVSRCDRPGRGSRRGGGVCVLHRDTFRVERLTVPTEGTALESLWLSVCSVTAVIIGVVYRPPNAPVDTVLDDLQRQLAHVCATDKPLYVLGDVNFDWLQQNQPGVRRYSQMLDDVNVKQIVREPTRPESGTLLDHAIVRSSDTITTARVVPCSWSDHDMVIAETPIRRERRRPPEFTARSTRSLVPDALCLDLLLTDWSAVRDATGPAAKWTAWLEVWSPIIDLHMPTVRVRPRHPPCPWLNDNESVRDLMRERDLAREGQRANRTPETTEYYRTCRNRVKSALSRAKSEFFLSSYRFSRKTTWKDIRRYLITPKGGIAPVTRIETTCEWADKLNGYFASVGPAVAAALEGVRRGAEPLQPRPPRVVAGSYRVHPATLPELTTALRRMSTSKASGEDGVTIAMLRMTWPVIGQYVLSVVNSSLVSGSVPEEWKRAIVVPIHKSGSVTEPSNYRPVSILPVVSKLVESVVCIQLLQYLLSHSILTDVQHGFRPGRLTESAMLDAVSYFMDCLDGGHIACLTTADTSKAFDSVCHPRLLEKMGWYGIQDHWFRDWLEGRSQRVKGGQLFLPITHGVVQGSLLGPVLFILFSNDLPSYVNDCKLVIYADDVQFGHKGEAHQMSDLESRVEGTFNTAQQWFTANSLKINPAKTDLVLIKSKRRQVNNPFSITIGDAKIEPSSSTKVLGMMVDSSLTFEAHISAVIRRCYATIGGLSKFSRSLPESVKKMIIETLVLPHITYCMTVWAGCGTIQKHRLQKVLNHCAQLVKGARRSAHVTPLLRELKWPSIDDLVAERDVGMVHWLNTSQHAPVSLRERMVSREDVSARTTRATQAGQLQLPRVRTEQARRFFHFRAASCWNAAPDTVKKAKTSALCRKHARKWRL